jgi:hypothetical protein
MTTAAAGTRSFAEKKLISRRSTFVHVVVRGRGTAILDSGMALVAAGHHVLRHPRAQALARLS